MKKNKVTVCVIGNAHIDPVWLWTWREGMAEVLASCRSALDRMKEFDAFIFTRAEAATYQWIEESCPEMFEEIKQRIKEGRWNVVGGWWEQPDCNVPCGESFVRQALYGKRYFKEKFGIDVKVGYNVDSFGHNMGLPQILKKSGIDYYTFMRPEPKEKELPSSMFWWEGLDGSKVLVYRLHGPYCTNHEFLPEHLQESVDQRHSEATTAACFYGVGNHGGGPTIENIKCILEMQKEQTDKEIIFGTLEQLFKTAEENCSNFPVVKDDLQHHAIGCYSLHSEVKKLNRKSENALMRAEKFASMANLLINRKYPKTELETAWKNVLFNQFHDILAGTSLPSAYEDARNTFGAALHSADYITEASLTNIAWHISADDGTDPFIVFNPHAQEIKAPVYYEENLLSLKIYNGKKIATQKVNEQFERTATDHAADRDRMVFVDTIPAFGYKLYYAESNDCTDDICSNVKITNSTIENEWIKLSISKETGGIVELYDKKQNHNFISSPAYFAVLHDKSDTWSHGVKSYTDEIGMFENAKIQIAETGPVRSTIRIESKYSSSTLLTDISLYNELKYIEIKCTLDWYEKNKILKFRIPVNIDNPEATYESSYSHIKRPADGRENPGQRWIDLSNSKHGLAMINDSKYGFDVKDNIMSMTILRSPIYAFHEPAQEEEGKRYQYIDQGRQEFSIILFPHKGSWKNSEVVQTANIMNMPLYSLETFIHKGTLPQEQSFCEISSENVELATLKQADDGNGFIVRLFENSDKNTNFTLRFFNQKYELSIKANELKTLRIAGGKAIEVNLIEE